MINDEIQKAKSLKRSRLKYEFEFCLRSRLFFDQKSVVLKLRYGFSSEVEKKREVKM